MPKPQNFGFFILFLTPNQGRGLINNVKFHLEHEISRGPVKIGQIRLIDVMGQGTFKVNNLKVKVLKYQANHPDYFSGFHCRILDKRFEYFYGKLEFFFKSRF